MVAIFIVLWIVAIVAAGVVMVSIVQLSAAAMRRHSQVGAWSLMLALVFLLTTVGLLILLVKYTQQAMELI